MRSLTGCGPGARASRQAKGPWANMPAYTHPPSFLLEPILVALLASVVAPFSP